MVLPIQCSGETSLGFKKSFWSLIISFSNSLFFSENLAAAPIHLYLILNCTVVVIQRIKITQLLSRNGTNLLLLTCMSFGGWCECLKNTNNGIKRVLNIKRKCFTLHKLGAFVRNHHVSFKCVSITFLLIQSHFALFPITSNYKCIYQSSLKLGKSCLLLSMHF